MDSVHAYRPAMTARQQEALDFIRDKQRIVTVGPSHRELAEKLGIAANAAQQKVNALRKSGFLAPADGRGLVLASTAVETPARKPIPRPSGKL